MKKSRVIFLFVTIVVIVLGVTLLSDASSNTPVLYRNDTKYNIMDYPVELLNGEIYVPISFFVGLSNIQYEYAINPASFYLRNKVTGRYLSYSSSAQYIIVDSEITNISFPIKNSTVYMPLEYCADVLSLKIEKRTDFTTRRVRLTDGTEKLSFRDLIDLYTKYDDPDLPSVINPGYHNPLNPSDTSLRSLYILFESRNSENANEALDILKNEKARATFFFDKEAMTSNPEVVIRAFVEGHGIGIFANTVEEAESANDTLYSILYLRSRLLRIEEGSQDEAEFAEKGYVIWSADFDASDWKDKSAGETAKDLYNKTFTDKNTVICFDLSEKSVDVVKRILYYTLDDVYIITRIADPTVNP